MSESHFETPMVPPWKERQGLIVTDPSTRTRSEITHTVPTVLQDVVENGPRSQGEGLLFFASGAENNRLIVDRIDYSQKQKPCQKPLEVGELSTNATKLWRRGEGLSRLSSVKKVSFRVEFSRQLRGP